MKKTKILAMIAAILLLAACEKEKTNFLYVSAENYRGAGKAYINNQYACWENGDLIRLSIGDTNYAGSIAIDHSGGTTNCTASATDFNPQTGEIIYAGYPRSLFSSVSCTTNITMPSTYTYTLTNGYQKLEAPMVAAMRKNGATDSLKFVNLCAMLKVHLTTSTSAASIDTIQVIKSADTAHGVKGLTGRATVYTTYSTSNDPCTSTLAMQDALTNDNNTITLNLGKNAISISSGRPADVYIPIPPLEKGTAIKIRVHNALTGNWTEDNGHPVSTALPGNVIATINAPEITESSAYTFYDYIENTGNAYIDLGVPPDYGQKMEITFMVRSGISNSQYYAGAREGSAGSLIHYGLVCSSGNNYFTACFLSQDAVQDPVNYVTTNGSMTRQDGVIYRQTMEIKETSTAGHYRGVATFEQLDASFNTVSIVTGSTTADRLSSSNELAGAPTIKVFAVGQSYQESMCMYSYRIWDASGTLIHNYTPASKVVSGNTVYGVYDKVTHNFKEQSGGNGSFSCANTPTSK